MEVAIEGNRVVVKGQFKIHRDYTLFKEAVETVRQYGETPCLVFEDALSLPSSAIGYILSLKGKGAPFSAEIHKKELNDLIADLRLGEVFGVA